MKVLGADGCRGRLGRRRAATGSTSSTASTIVVADATVVVVGVDMPIGLPDEWSRDADRQARRLLGRPGASSVSRRHRGRC